MDAACFFCGSVGAPHGHCSKCLVGLADPEIDPPLSPQCPRCMGRLLAIDLSPERAVVHACLGCHGVFIPPRAWAFLVSRPEVANELEAKLPPRNASPPMLVPFVRCPTCACEMDRGRFAATSGVVIDVCSLHGSWVDSGELRAVLLHVGYLARGFRLPLERAMPSHFVATSIVHETTRIQSESQERMAGWKKTSYALGFGLLLFRLCLAFTSSQARAHAHDPHPIAITVPAEPHAVPTNDRARPSTPPSHRSASRR